MIQRNEAHDRLFPYCPDPLPHSHSLGRLGGGDMGGSAAVLERHTPWARAEFVRTALWLACYCGWNANRNAEGSWNDHFLAALDEAAQDGGTPK